MNYNFVKSRLPAEYQEVAYIESHGTEWIDEGFKPNQDTKVMMDIELTSWNSPVLGIEGVSTSYGVNQYEIIAFQVDSKPQFRFGTYVGAIGSPVINLGKHRIKADKNGFIIDDVLIDVPPFNIFTCDYNSYLFARNRGGSATVMTAMKLIKHQVFNLADNSLIRHYVPCFRRSDGVIGLYDLCGTVCPLTGTPFYINAGTGAFTKGPNVQELIPFYIARKTAELSQFAKELNSTNWTGGSSANVTYLNGVATARITSIGYWAGILQPGTNFELDHKLVVVFKARYNSATNSKLLVALRCAGYYNSNNYVNVSNSDLTQVGVVLNITSYRYTSNNDFIIVADYGYSETPIINDSIEIKDVNIFDLTDLFGSGNEPTTYAEARRRIKLLTGRDIAYYQDYGLNQAICGPTAIYGG